MPNQNSNLAVLQRQYPGAILISLADTARALGTTDGTIRVQIHRGKFPIKTVRRGTRRYVPIVELARYLDDLIDAAPDPRPRRRGRPRKSAAATATPAKST